MDVTAVAVNVIISWILESEETKFYGCNCSSCKRYNKLYFRKGYFRKGRNILWM